MQLPGVSSVIRALSDVPLVDTLSSRTRQLQPYSIWTPLGIISVRCNKSQRRNLMTKYTTHSAWVSLRLTLYVTETLCITIDSRAEQYMIIVSDERSLSTRRLHAADDYLKFSSISRPAWCLLGRLPVHL